MSIHRAWINSATSAPIYKQKLTWPFCNFVEFVLFNPYLYIVGTQPQCWFVGPIVHYVCLFRSISVKWCKASVQCGKTTCKPSTCPHVIILTWSPSYVACDNILVSYRLWSKGDNMFGSVRPSGRPRMPSLGARVIIWYWWGANRLMGLNLTCATREFTCGHRSYLCSSVRPSTTWI